MELNLKIKVLGAAAAGAGLSAMLAGASGFLIGRSSSNLSGEQTAYEAGIRIAAPLSAEVRMMKPEQCPAEVTIRSFMGNVRLKKDEVEHQQNGGYVCKYKVSIY